MTTSVNYPANAVYEAIECCRQENRLFIAVVLSTDENSARAKVVVDSDVIQNALRDYVCCMVTVIEGTPEHEAFVEIYGPTPLPSCFIIGPDGIPVSILEDMDIHEQGLLAVLKQLPSVSDRKKVRQPEDTSDCTGGECKELNQGDGSSCLQETDKEQEYPKCSQSRLQFRFPSGELFPHEFSSKSTLAAVAQWLEAERGITDFQLSRSYPRHIFSDEEMEQTLEDLSLFPSGTLCVCMSSDYSSCEQASPPIRIVSFMIRILMLPLDTFSFLCGHLVALLPTSSQRWFARQSFLSNSSNSNRVVAVKNEGVRIHRLNVDEEDDGEMKTYNGNSTQQM